MEENMFPYLVIGIAKLLQKQTRSYPYPHELQYSLNRIAVALRTSYPKTLGGLLKLLEQPVEKWWVGEYPTDFDKKAPLIEDGELSFEATEYLEQLSNEDAVPLQASLEEIEVVLDNRKFKRLRTRLQEEYRNDPVGAQQEYVILRRFIIEHPFARTIEIGQVFNHMRYVEAVDVGELYIDTATLASQMTYPTLDGNSAYWCCLRCGPLFVKSGQLESVKPSACYQQCPRHLTDGWQSMTPSRQLKVIRKGIHLRTHLPGIPEIRLFSWLQNYQSQFPDLLKEVSLWPSLDAYDLQIRFSDSTWAVDVKDHRDPHRLASQLTTLRREENMNWDRGFYVYPNYREKQWLDYSGILREKADRHLKDIQIHSDEVFRDMVLNKLQSLKKGR